MITGLAQRLAGPILALLLPAAGDALEVSSPDNRIAFSIETGDDSVELRLAAGGGAAVRLQPDK